MINNEKTTDVPAKDKEGNPKLSKEGRQLMVNMDRNKIMIEEFLEKKQKEEDDMI